MKRMVWLFIALGLLGLAAFLMSRGDKPKRAERALDVEFPRYPRGEELNRNQRRRTLPPVQMPQNDENTEEPAQRRDPLIVALPSGKNKSTVVFEIEELKDSPIGKAWLDCLMEREGKRGLDDFKGEFGFNPLEDVERVAVSSAPLMIMSVRGDGPRLDRPGFSKRTHGDKGVIYEAEEKREAFGTWGDLVLMGPNAQTIEDAIARLESDVPVEPAIPEWSMYGDIYGVLSPEELSRMIPNSQDALANKVRDAVDRVDLHVDASEDVAIVADVEGPGREDIEDLGKSFGAALALARLQAQDSDDEKLAQLLDYAAVHPRDNRFSLDVALPFEVLKDMGPCRKWDEYNPDAGEAASDEP